MRTVSFLPLFAAVALLSSAAPALADDVATAEQTAEAAMAEMKARRFDTACPAFQKAYRLDPKPATLFHYAECEDQYGRIATAAAAYDDYLAIYDRLSKSEQKDELVHEEAASARRQAIEPEIPRVTLHLPANTPDGTRVMRVPSGGGEPIDVAVAVPLPIDPGEQIVITDSPGHPRWDKRFFVFKGDRKTIELEIAPVSEAKALRFGQPLAAVPTLLPPLDPGITQRRTMAYAFAGVGAAGIVVGAVTGAIVFGDKGIINDNCVTHVCNSSGSSAASQAHTAGLVSTISFAVGLTSLAVGVILFLTEAPPPKLGATSHSLNVASTGFSPKPGSLGTEWEF